MSTTTHLAAYDTAKDIYNTLIAGRSAVIAQEKAKRTPDQARIDAMIREKIALRQQSNDLSFDDIDTIEYVIRIFGPILKERNKNIVERSPEI